MFSLLVTTAVFSTAVAIRVTECPTGSMKEKLISHLVKYDPAKFYSGTFVDYIVSPPRIDPKTCTCSTYTNVAGKIKAHTEDKALGKKLQDSCEEIYTPDGGNGQYKVTGTLLEPGMVGEKYEGKFYTFYADQNVIGYYYCEFKEIPDNELGSVSEDRYGDYNAVLSVKREKLRDLLENKDQSVSASVEAAKKKFEEVKKAFDSWKLPAETAKGQMNLGPFKKAVDNWKQTDESTTEKINYEYLMNGMEQVHKKYLDCY